jgi:hypothetical protein
LTITVENTEPFVSHCPVRDLSKLLRLIEYRDFQEIGMKDMPMDMPPYSYTKISAYWYVCIHAYVRDWIHLTDEYKRISKVTKYFNNVLMYKVDLINYIIKLYSELQRSKMSIFKRKMVANFETNWKLIQKKIIDKLV